MRGSYELIRAIRGPIVLITLGVLFSLDQADKLGFDRTWPVLFIVFGVMKLIERLLAPPPPPPPAYYPPAPPAGGPWQQPPTTGGYQS
jgi:hypothetical protein